MRTGAAIKQALILAKCVYCPLSQGFSENPVPELVAQVRENWVFTMVKARLKSSSDCKLQLVATFAFNHS